ncbi:hypothetical protein [Thalassobacillus sp. CUG 92003]|uniref:hypothetical protein n=1 Tax=Thalassobacillus sp. CUG 92003 TaxID=2736641 RepID=UPI0015E67773|nr:hypothetical protein [Thalassobacillus sp. CUG 92003]
MEEYYKVKSAENPDKELRSTIGSHGQYYEYDFEGFYKFPNFESAYKEARLNMGFVIRVREEAVTGGWAFVERDGKTVFGARKYEEEEE